MIILTLFALDVEVRRALETGARFYVLSSARERDFIRVSRDVHGGKRSLPSEIAAQLADCGEDGPTVREVKVQLVAPGNRNRDVADKLSVGKDD